MPPKLVAIGDLQGNLSGLEILLRAAGLIDRAGRWAGGRSVLVQLGDIFGRAQNPRGVCDLLRDLADEADEAGGAVHVILGNHEAEVVHRYEFECDPREYVRFATHASLRKWKRERALAEESFWSLGHEESLPLSNLVRAWELLHPVGREEFRSALAPRGEYGRWICSLPAAIKVGPILFSHAGVLPPYAKMGLEDMNEIVSDAMQSNAYFPAMPEDNVLLDPDGPLWTRALAWGARGLKSAVAEVERRMDTTVQVIGHTPTDDYRIRTRQNHHIVCIDTGVGRPKEGRLSALVVQDGVMWAIYPPREKRKLGTIPTRPQAGRARRRAGGA
jgi:hypothetical protein